MEVRRLIPNRMFHAKVSHEVFDWRNSFPSVRRGESSGGTREFRTTIDCTAAALAMKHWIGDIS